MTRAHFSAQIRTLAHPVCLVVAFFWHTGAWSQSPVQAGRVADGTLWLTDGTLPAGVKPVPLALDQTMTLPSTSAQPTTRPPTPLAATSTSNTEGKTPTEKATCRSIQQRVRETRAELDMVERKKAEGTLLIPNSGLATLRQNIATLERLQDLCD